MVEPDALARVTRVAARLARDRRTPFYAFDARLARAVARRWKNAARSAGRLELFYPYKCNRHPSLLDILAREGLGAEVACGRDLEAARSRGIGGERLILQGPAKDPDVLDRALSLGAWIVADGPEDGEAIAARAGSLRIRPRCLLRFRASSAEPSQGRFGFPPARIPEWARGMDRRGAIAPEGLAFHLGTGISSSAPFAAAVGEAGRIASRLREARIDVGVLDAGGGFAAEGEARRGASGRPRSAPPPPATVLARLSGRARRAIPGARVLAEPGRALASDAFTLVARVLRVTAGRVYVDASRMSHALFVPNGRHRFRAIPSRPGGGRVEVAGPLPVDRDRLSAGEALGRPRVADLILIGSVGAYNVIAANAWAGDLPEVVDL